MTHAGDVRRPAGDLASCIGDASRPVRSRRQDAVPIGVEGAVRRRG